MRPALGINVQGSQDIIQGIFWVQDVDNVIAAARKQVGGGLGGLDVDDVVLVAEVDVEGLKPSGVEDRANNSRTGPDFNSPKKVVSRRNPRSARRC